MQKVSDIAQNYYLEMGNKNVKGLEKYLHPNVLFVSPMVEMTGKERVLDAASNFMNLFESLKIQQKLENEHNAAVIVFDLVCPLPIGTFRAATLMTIQDGLISKMELFYDARPFERKKKEIFSEN